MTTNYLELPFDLIELRTHRKASVAKEENKPLRAEQTEERGPWPKQEVSIVVRTNNFTQQTNILEVNRHIMCESRHFFIPFIILILLPRTVLR